MDKEEHVGGQKRKEMTVQKYGPIKRSGNFANLFPVIYLQACMNRTSRGKQETKFRDELARRISQLTTTNQRLYSRALFGRFVEQ